MGYTALFPIIAAIILGALVMKQVSPSVTDSIKVQKVDSQIIQTQKAIFEAIQRYITLESANPATMDDLITKSYFPASSNTNGFGGSYSFVIDSAKGTVVISTEIADSYARSSFINSYKNTFKPVQGAGDFVDTTYVFPTSVFHGNGQFMAGIPVQSSAPNAATNKYWYDTSAPEVLLKMSDGTNWKTVATTVTAPSTVGSPVLASTGDLSLTADEGTIKYVYDSSSDTIQQYAYYGGNWVLSGGASGGSTTPTVPAGFIKIPGSEHYSFAGVAPANGWAIMKWEASYYSATPTSQSTTTNYYTTPYYTTPLPGNYGVQPITSMADRASISSISRNEAEALCQDSSILKSSAGTSLSNGHLVPFGLWKKIANDASQQSINWSSGVVGTDNMSRGIANNNSTKGSGYADFSYNDNYNAHTTVSYPALANFYDKRVWRLSSGDVIHDFSGNLNEWYYDTSSTTSSTVGYQEYSSGSWVVMGIFADPPVSTWDSNRGIGRIYPTFITAGTSYAAVYGGYWSDTVNAGVYSGYWNTYSPSTVRYPSVGFRCVVPIL